METTSGLNAAIRYIEKRLFDAIDLTEAARLAFCSEYQFRRMFSYFADMPLNEYIRKRRLSLVTELLHPGDGRIIDISQKCGYDSPDAFSKAFSAQFGITPSAYRKNPVPLKLFPPLYFQLTIMEGIGVNSYYQLYQFWPTRHYKQGGVMSSLSEFTPIEREKCLPIINQMIEIANLTRKEGVLALEEWAKKHDNSFLTFLVMMVCDGIDPEFVKGIGETLLDSGGYKGEELLSRMMMIEGMLSVQAGENPRILEMKLLSMLGEKYLMARGYLSSDGQPHFPGHDKRVEALKAQTGLPQSAEFNKTFIALGNRDVQCVLRETDQHDLCIAMKGCDGATGEHIMYNLSKRLGAMILESMELMGPVRIEDILTAQEKLLAIVTHLRKTGDIV